MKILVTLSCTMCPDLVAAAQQIHVLVCSVVQNHVPDPGFAGTGTGDHQALKTGTAAHGRVNRGKGAAVQSLRGQEDKNYYYYKR